ncbi:Wzz/FepE/Etk N-terminal domain-containing protein [Sphingomonas sp. BIUV-7]|uniref:Wzz/FepE/Etk N-terminal domain-containing protein n=1 Tax=Sphingomonas natans TaxID=3063330 RepID=A0ABT8YFJ0_9SPHN|nr:Wzz/FepE/Etk N-terminal domain-containing protein [Sphingomonas sp. BIUV-7]MDO6416802.1 Wzz/FepE/Etk N-terminal domain-containing protein [Sphingomonas sp. BIUV-7]
MMNPYPNPGPLASIAQQDDEEGGGSGLIQALPVILWERRWWIIIPGILALIAGVAAAYTIPTMYESSGTVLIESQQLPIDIVNSPVTDVIGQRIARARERVLSRQDLIRLIRTNNLYADEQRRRPLSQIVDTMRDATTIDAIGADTGNTGRTIALKIGFSYSDPVKAQIVAQQYVNRFLEVDASAQTDQAVGAANFLNQQGGQLQAQIAAIENQITKIKTENGPLLAMQAQSTGNPGADAARIDAEIANLQAENARLSQAPISVENGTVQAAQIALANAKARYSDTHPDVIAAQNQLDAARRATTAAAAPSSSPMIGANNVQISSLRAAKGLILSQTSEVRSAQSRGPGLAAEVDALEKRADALRDQYRDIGSKAQSAQLSARMQTEQKGERLTLADPPVVPDAPYKPNRPLLILGALIGGLGLGFGVVLLLELLLRPIRGTEMLRDAAGSAPLVIIPDYSRKANFMIRWLERRNRRRART